MNNVDHPPHYNSRSVECIEVVQLLPFCTGNAVKYLWRAGSKGDLVEDLQKARWYAVRAIHVDLIGSKEAKLAARIFGRVVDEFGFDTAQAIISLIDGRPSDALHPIDQLIEQARP